MQISSDVDNIIKYLTSTGLTYEFICKEMYSYSASQTPTSLYGQLSKNIYGSNRKETRNKLYLKFKNNSYSIQELLRNSFLPKILIVTIKLNDISNVIKTDLILKEISNKYLNTTFSKVKYFELNIENAEAELKNQCLLALWSSGSTEMSIYKELENYYTNIPNVDSDNESNKYIFQYFNNCDSELFFIACNYFDVSPPKKDLFFILFQSISDIQVCDTFSKNISKNLSVKILERTNLLYTWIISSGIDCQLINDLFSKEFACLSSNQIDQYLQWINRLKEDYKQLGCECFQTLATCCKNIFSKSSNYIRSSDIDLCLNDNITCESTSYFVTNEPNTISCTNAQHNLSTFCGEFFLDEPEWSSIYDHCALKLNRDWTQLFATKIGQFNSQCVLKFEYYKMSKIGSRKKTSPFLRAKASCKFKNCYVIIFLIESFPKFEASNYMTVKFEMLGTLSTLHNSGNFGYGRNLSASKREIVGHALRNSSVCQYFYKQFTEESITAACYSGNLNNLKSQNCLRKIKSETNSVNRFSNDQFEDLIISQKKLCEQFKGNTVQGYIQNLSSHPFTVHLYTEKQIEVLKLFNSHKIILNLDATGSLISKLNSTSKKIFYYALTIQHPTHQTSPIPLAELISNQHDTAEISHFLNKWYLTVKLFLKRQLEFSQIETDFSWALIHSVCHAFFKTTLLKYLSNCGEIIFANKKMDSNPILHLCTAHIMHGISYKLKEKYVLEKNFRYLVMHVIGAIVSSSNIVEVEHLFTSLCYVLCTRYKCSVVYKHVTELEHLVKKETDFSSELPEELDEECEDIVQSEKYKHNSPFGKHFNALYNEILKEISIEENRLLKYHKKVDNAFYNTSIISYLLSYYMPLLPLWSGILMTRVRCVTTDSNASVENWFRIVKHQICNSETNIRAGDFVRLMCDNIHSRVEAFKFCFMPMSTKVIKLKTRESGDIENSEMCSEKWSKRKKTKFGYIKPTTTNISNVFDKLNAQFKKPLSLDYGNNSSSLQRGVSVINSNDVQIINDLDILELASIRYTLPPYKPITCNVQYQICMENNLDYIKAVSCVNKNVGDLYNYIPSVMEHIEGDGNCLFSSLAYWITGTATNHLEIRKLIVHCITNKLNEVCTKFIETKWPSTFRNTRDYINKTRMANAKTFGTDVELFSAAYYLEQTFGFSLLIWVTSG